MRKKLLVALSLILFMSCVSTFVGVALKKVGATDKKATLKKLDYKDKDILFLEMIHLGQKEFFEDVKHKTDSLNELGYFIFHEGFHLKKSEVPKISDNDTVALKFRKVTGIDPLIDYSKAKSLVPYVDEYNLVDQPDYIKLGLTSSNSKAVDIAGSKLIEIYEKEKGEIRLYECDYESKLGNKNYDCKQAKKADRKYFMDEILIGERDKHIYENIQETDKNKILIIYGKKHFNGVKRLLNE